jgi:hypothetical protein
MARSNQSTTIVKVYVGDRELKDIITNTIKTDSNVQDQVRRIVKAA